MLHRVVSTPIKSGAIEEIKLLSHRGRNWIITASIGIWWTLCIRDCDSLQEVTRWSPGKVVFNGIAVNSDDQSDAAIAVSVRGIGFVSKYVLVFLLKPVQLHDRRAPQHL